MTPGYSRGGIEAEYHGGHLAFPSAIDDSAALKVSLRMRQHLRRHLPWVASNDRHGLKVVMDIGAFDVDINGGVAMYRTAQAPVDRVAQLPILEFVTERPLAEPCGVLPRSTTAALDTLVQTLNRLDIVNRTTASGGRPCYGVEEILPASEGWTLHPNAVAVRFLPVRVGTSATVLTHHTKGVPLGAVAQFMRGVGERIWQRAVRRLHEDGAVFASSVAESLRGRCSGGGQVSRHGRLCAAETCELEGAMWLTYVHVAGLALSAMYGGSIGPGKKFSAVVLRQSLRSLRGELSPRVRDFLDSNAETIRASFDNHLIRRVPAFNARYIEARNRSRERHRVAPEFHLDPPQLVEHNRYRPSRAVRYARLKEAHGQHSLMVGDYLDTMLLHDPAVTVNQYQAFGVRTYFSDLDRARPGAPGLLLLELRYDSRQRLTPEQLGRQYTELTHIVQRAISTVE